jgi:hypothetical protein
MNCKQVEELLPLYAGRDLEEKRARLVTEHLQTCAVCARVADAYRDSVQLTEQFAPPVFSEAVYAGIRQRVLRKIEKEATAPSWSQTIASSFRPRLMWAIASVLLIVVSLFAIYFFVNRKNDEPLLANQPAAEVQPGTKEHSDSEPQDSKRAGLPPSQNTSGKKQQLAGIPRARPKRSRDLNTFAAKSPDAVSTANNVSPQPRSLLDPMIFPRHDSAAKTLRMEIQTQDPKIRIIWFVQQETKPIIPSSKGT